MSSVVISSRTGCLPRAAAGAGRPQLACSFRPGSHPPRAGAPGPPPRRGGAPLAAGATPPTGAPAQPSSKPSISAEVAKELYRDMVLGREFEEMCAQMYYRGKMFGFVHLYSGQEAVSTGTQVWVWEVIKGGGVVGKCDPGA